MCVCGGGALLLANVNSLIQSYSKCMLRYCCTQTAAACDDICVYF